MQHEPIEDALKRLLAQELCAILTGWNTTEGSMKMRIHPSRISELRHGKLKGFSISRLVRLIAMHGYHVEFTLRPLELPTIIPRKPTATVVRYDRFNRAIPRPERDRRAQ